MVPSPSAKEIKIAILEGMVTPRQEAAGPNRWMLFEAFRTPEGDGPRFNKPIMISTLAPGNVRRGKDNLFAELVAVAREHMTLVEQVAVWKANSTKTHDLAELVLGNGDGTYAYGVALDWKESLRL